MSDISWIDPLVAAARPQAVAALLRYFRDLDLAEEAFQEACLRALKNWPRNGPPRDPAAWLIFIGRNAAIDMVRRRSRTAPLPDEHTLSDLEDAETALFERLDGADYRDDILRLLFVCCHPDLPATQQVALALRIVSGLSVKQIARAFLVRESAMEQRITRAKARIAAATMKIPGVIAYFTVSDSKAATAFYQKAFGAKLIDRRETPDGRSMHVHVEINGGAMMFNDPFPEHGTPDELKKNITLHIIVDDADAWWKRATDAGADIVVPLEVAFWGDKYGQLKDAFGVTWGIVGPA